MYSMVEKNSNKPLTKCFKINCCDILAKAPTYITSSRFFFILYTNREIYRDGAQGRMGGYSTFEGGGWIQVKHLLLTTSFSRN